jgi:hypothetical protein
LFGNSRTRPFVKSRGVLGRGTELASSNRYACEPAFDQPIDSNSASDPAPADAAAAAAGFLGGIIVAILVVRVGSIAILILAAASGLGATIAWWIRGARIVAFSAPCVNGSNVASSARGVYGAIKGPSRRVEPATAGAAKQKSC